MSIVRYFCFILNIDEPLELPEEPETAVRTEEVLFNVLGLVAAGGKYPSPPNPWLGGVLDRELFITASGL
jgi:hypothetical protein